MADVLSPTRPKSKAKDTNGEVSTKAADASPAGNSDAGQGTFQFDSA